MGTLRLFSQKKTRVKKNSESLHDVWIQSEEKKLQIKAAFRGRKVESLLRK